MVETANATVGCVEHSLLPSSGDVFSTFRVTGWSAKALSVVRIRLFEKFVNSAIQNYGPIMVHEPVPTTTKHAFGSHPRRVFSISYLLTGFFHGGNTGSNPVGDANKIKNFRKTTAFLHGPIWSSYDEAIFFMTIFTSLLWASRFWGLTACI
jgi:hypothetical protein